LCQADPSVKAKSQVYLCQKCSNERLGRQNRTFSLILIITEAHNAHFFVCKPNGFAQTELRDFAKMTLTQVILWKTWHLTLVSGEISDFAPCAHAQSDILHVNYAEKTDD